MKIWIDDVREPPNEEDVFWYWARSVKDAIRAIESFEWQFKIELIDIDHDAGDYASDGGDYIRVLDWLAETGRNYPIHIHSMNVVGRENMQRIIRKNGWTEVL